MLILIKCSQIALIFIFFIFGSSLVQGEIVDLSGESVTEDLEAGSEATCSCTDACGDGICQSQGCGRCNLSCCESQDFCPQDCLYAKEEGQEFIEKMKQRLKKVQPNPQSEQPLDNSAAFLQKGEGFLTKCSYQVGEKTCGKCYCLKANPGSSIVFNGRQLRGCARLEISLVGDLAAFVDQAVYYEGISEFNSSFICPQHFKLLRIKPVAEKLENF